MFEPSDKPRVFGIPPGADFPRHLVDEVLARYSGRSPQDLARVRILVNTQRMQRRLKTLFSEGQARLLPRIGVITDVDAIAPGVDLPIPVAGLRRRLEMAELVKALIGRDPDLAPRSAAVDLADSLAALMDEMQSEGISPDRFSEVDIGDDSAHWKRSLAFLGIANTYLNSISGFGIDKVARRRAAIEHTCASWEQVPPDSPIIVAGSTGSQAATALLMRGVARLPQGALVLPGFDFDLPDEIWSALSEGRTTEDHPQYRFAALLKSLDITRSDVRQWGNAPDESRNRLISLSLRPAHVTDQWLTEGAGLGDLVAATKDLTLIKAPQPADESLAIAVALREAVERGERAALITPDRNLARRVAAALSRWDIKPDDSAGVPLSLTPPGRFLRQIIQLVGQPVAPETLLPLLKHPLTRSGGDGRGPHMLASEAFELFCRRKSVVTVTAQVLDEFVTIAEGDVNWARSVTGMLSELAVTPPARLQDMAQHHINLAQSIARGVGGKDAPFNTTSAGRQCLAIIDSFLAESDFSGDIPLPDYVRLFDKALAAESDRSPDTVHPEVMIWGTLEARVQGADLVILGGLNDGVWPEQPNPDPWLNRRMRQQLGLLLPDRQIGLAAHDYQQAVAAKRVILSRAARDNDSETVPSRWLNRLTNLLAGLPDQGGLAALDDMSARGDAYLSLARTLRDPGQASSSKAPRPAPSPPVAVRPKSYSVTEIKTLIRDPYAIYARRILGLDALNPLVPTPDARMKGTVFHEIFEKFFSLDATFSDPNLEHARLRDISHDVLSRLVPWPSVRAEWSSHISKISDWLISTEIDRLSVAAPLARERKGGLVVPGTDIAIRGKADRIDRLHAGGLVIYDYKTGTVSTKKQVKNFDRQLLIEAIMAEHGAFKDIPPEHVDYVAYIGAGRTPKFEKIALVSDDEADFRIETVSRELAELLSAFDSPDVGYISRRAMETESYNGDYDHLARYGEWSDTETTEPERL